MKSFILVHKKGECFWSPLSSLSADFFIWSSEFMPQKVIKRLWTEASSSSSLAAIDNLCRIHPSNWGRSVERSFKSVQASRISQGYMNPGNACKALVLHKIHKGFQIRKLNKWDENIDQIFCLEQVILNPEQSNWNLTPVLWASRIIILILMPNLKGICYWY